MAEEPGEFDKTEEPTQKRLEEALKRGDVVKSQEVNTWFVIAGAALVLNGQFLNLFDPKVVQIRLFATD